MQCGNDRERVPPPGLESIHSSPMLPVLSKASRDQQVLALVVSRDVLPLTGLACISGHTFSLPEIILAFFSTKQPALLFVCLLITYFSLPLEDHVRSDPLLLKHQIEGRAVLSVKVYNNLSIHRMQNNKM